MHRLLCLLFVAMLLVAASATATTATSGTVYLDRNGDGVRAADEPGIAGVAISNGRIIVRSDAAGRYAIAVTAGDTVFAIKPAGHAFTQARFWRHHFPAGHAPLKYAGIGRTADDESFDIGLRPAAARRPGLEVLVFADPQPKSMTDVDYYARDIVEPIIGRYPGAAFGITLGDVVSDDLALYPAMQAQTARLGLPWLHVAGNHDVDVDAARDAGSLLSFRQAFGPDTLAWEEDAATFIALDDVLYRPGAKPAYVGGLRPDQFAFLRAYLPTVAKDRLLVIAAHIPLFDTASPGAPETFRRTDRAQLFALLQGFPHVLLLTAHGHVQRHVLHDATSDWHGATPLHEYNVGAACGAFWSGVKDAAGIPDSRMSDGTPNGYATLQVRHGGGYDLHWHVARAAGDRQIALHAPKVLRHNAYPAFAVYANVFMGRSDSRVEYRIDAGPWLPMDRVARADPGLLAENVRDDASNVLRGYDRAPEAVPSTHLWRGTLPTDLAAGTHRIRVRALDRALRGAAAETSYRLVEAAAGE